MRKPFRQVFILPVNLSRVHRLPQHLLLDRVHSLRYRIRWLTLWVEQLGEVELVLLRRGRVLGLERRVLECLQ
jgi:hypothetical protein